MQLSIFDIAEKENPKIKLEELFHAYFECRKNKRNTANALAFEIDYENNLVQLCKEINSGTYKIGRSIAFIVDKPVKREIFAADFRDRVVHHLIIGKLNQIEIAHVNEAWRGIAEEALIEMQEEARKTSSPLRLPDKELHGDTVWSYRIKMAIHYFDIMVMAAIEKDIDYHMWMHYYEHFANSIIDNMPPLPGRDSESNRCSRNYSLIEDMFKNMMEWNRVAINSNNRSTIECIFDVIGRCIYSITATDKLRLEDKGYLMNWIWEGTLVHTFPDNDNQQEIVEKIVSECISIFKKPSGLFLSSDTIKSARYLDALQYMWRNRDQPKLYGAVTPRVDRFKTEVINSLGLRS